MVTSYFSKPPLGGAALGHLVEGLAAIPGSWILSVAQFQQTWPSDGTPPLLFLPFSLLLCLSNE